MSAISIIDTASGELKRIVFANTPDMALQDHALAGETAVAGHPPPIPAGFKAVYASGAWANVSARTLDQAKAERTRAILAEREAAKAAGISYQGNTYRTDLEGRQLILEQGWAAFRAAALALPYTGSLVNSLGVEVTLNAQQAQAVCTAMVDHVQTQEHTAQTLLAAVGAATNIEDVDQIDWPTS